MGLFTTGSRASAGGRSEARAWPSEPGPVPARFEAIGDALASDPALRRAEPGAAVLAACEYVGLGSAATASRSRTPSTACARRRCW